MWNEIVNNETLKEFNEKLSYFHDSCIKEIYYLSGAYVDENLEMYPINDCRILRVIIQCQNENEPMIEMEFQDLKYLKLFPIDPHYTCEILDSTILLKEDCIIWCDCENEKNVESENDARIFICAAKLRWRSISGYMGNKKFFKTVK